MTAEKIMGNLLVIARELNADEKELFDFVRKNNLKKSTFSGVGARLGELCVEIEEQIRTESAKRSGKSGVKRGMESILKSAKKLVPYKEWLHYAYNDGDYQIACNTYMIAELSDGNHVPLAKRPDSGAFEWRMPNWKNQIPWECAVENRLVELPRLTDLKFYLKSEKSKLGKYNSVPITFDFGERLPNIKVEFLIAAMEILPDAKAYFAGCDNLCLLLRNDNDSAVYIMGNNLKKDSARRRTEI